MPRSRNRCSRVATETLVKAMTDRRTLVKAMTDRRRDAILAVNSLGFWTASAERLEDLRGRLTPGGRIAIASQPRCPGATRNTLLDAASEITELRPAAGFTRARTEVLDLDPPVVCVLAVNQACGCRELGHGR
jgi:hypothetical protein